MRAKDSIYLIPSLLTTCNLFAGLYAIIAVMNANYLFAAIALLVAMIFDALDGKFARLTNTTSRFGLEYDSLVDVVSFGVAPGILIYSWALSARGMFGSAVVFAFVACASLRLARFNAQDGGGDNRVFTGLPVPAAAGVIATLVLFDHHILRLGREVKPLLILIMTLVLAFLMVSAIRYRSFKDFDFRRGRQFNYLVMAVLVLMLVAAAPQLTLFVLFAGYAVSGPLEPIVRKLLKKPIGQPVTHDVRDTKK
ncbi:MAG TPA: CDP-diacylglycerol--serine O-phosphatidyltransferase [Nitrospirales bacterium]|nr:CDP-diacylglycerol--serine O-phosphatidyltransferase [Nitrospirales bacterium]